MRISRKILPRMQQLLFSPLCWGCNTPLRRQRDFCHSCRREILGALAKDGCLLRYQGAVAGLLACLRGSAPRMAAAWCLSLLEKGGQVRAWKEAGVQALVLAPQNPREGERGLVLLGRALAGELRVPLIQPFEKTGKRSQHGRSYAERLDGPCFARLEADSSLLREKRILLLDDVYTTGTTLEQCAYLLRKAAAAEVITYSLARQMMKGFERKQRESGDESEEMNPLLLHLFV